MSLFPYLQLQTIDPQDDGSISELDTYEEDETFDLNNDTDGETIERKLDEMIRGLHDPTNQSIQE